jgi:hypothetical protein
MSESRYRMKNGSYRDPASEKLLPERRSGVDRRSPTTIQAVFFSRHRRRKSRGRRRTDKGAYIDIYDSRSWSIAIAVVALSFLDAVLTGLHMVRGSARELNPILESFLNRGGLPMFFGAKAAMTLLPVAVILIHKEWTLGRFAAWLCLWAYILLTLYHLYLLFAVGKLSAFLFGNGA